MDAYWWMIYDQIYCKWIGYFGLLGCMCCINILLGLFWVIIMRILKSTGIEYDWTGMNFHPFVWTQSMRGFSTANGANAMFYVSQTITLQCRLLCVCACRISSWSEKHRVKPEYLLFRNLFSEYTVENAYKWEGSVVHVCTFMRTS